MKKNLVILLLAGVFALTACTSQKKLESDDDFSVESEEPAAGDDLSVDTPSDSGSSDDLSLDDLGSGDAEAKPSDNASAPAQAQDSDLALENELNSLDTPTDNQATNNQQQPAEELSLDEPAVAPDQAQVAQTPAEGEIPPPSEVNLNDPAQAQIPPENAPAEQVPPAELAATEPPPIVDSAPIVQDNGISQVPASINTVQYKGNANGGTVAIGADQPLVYTTRFNSTTNQFIVEVQNSSIPKKLKRSLNTKDMASSIGSIDIYQKDGSNVSRFVVQLRAGAPEPIVQPEGNSLLIIGASANASVVKNSTVPAVTAPIDAPVQDLTQAPAVDAPAQDAAGGGDYAVQGDVPKSANMGSNLVGGGGSVDREITPAPATGLLSYESLEEFLMSNTRFYGKKISIETLGMDVTDALKFLSEESGVNIIFDDKVIGVGKVNIKLREVPWDQAFVLILKSKKLAYKRQGNVIRVAALEDIRLEEDEAIKLKEARKKPDAVMVKRFFIAYAQVSEIKTKIEEYLSATDAARNVNSPNAAPKTGRILVDSTNNSLIISDSEKNLKDIEEIITALDTQPKQILIEAKVVEANENFATGLGVKWKSNGSGSASVNTGTIGINDNGSVKTSGQFNATINWGQIDFLGSLNASIALGENKSQLKTLSSPRVTVLSGQVATITQQKSFSVPVTSISNGSVTQTQTQRNVDLTLNVTPTATNEGTINLRLSVNRGIQQGTDGTLSSNANTTLFVRSGATAVVGGIYASSASESDEGVPGLRNIPIIGSLFEARQKSNDKNELVIFVTPTILKPL
jgi:type IV pilus assembly protein PilQ